MSSAGGEFATVAESITKSLAEICDSDYQWECPRRFSTYAKRLDLLLNQFLKSTAAAAGELSPSARTALRGIAADISKANPALATYRTRSKIFVLINCQTLCDSLLNCSTSIARWLALLHSSLTESDSDSADLRRKMADLSSEMQLAQFKVTENEERVYCTLQKEVLGRHSTKAVQSAIIMDLARALGIESDNHGELARQIDLLKKDMTGSVTPSDRRISVCLGRIFDNWSVLPRTVSKGSDPDFEEDADIPPFRSFICPLTKEVMKEPVVLESSQSYERTAIQYWFDRCVYDGREPTCPVTGQVLKSLKLNPNIGLAGAIDEWINRNIDIQIRSAVQHLSDDPSSTELISNEMKNMYRISEEHPSKLYKVRNAGLIPLIVRLLRDSSSEIVGPETRTRVLMTLLNMSKDEESKHIMIEEGVMRLTIHSLIGHLKEEGQYALKLLLEFSANEHYCTKLAVEKGALLLLSSIAGDTDNPSLANLAEEALKNIEKLEINIQHLAAAGRFQPLLNRLCEGSLDVKLEMAAMVGKMTLANNGKEEIARHGAKVLVKMLSSEEDARLASLQALHNLSSLDDNAVILVDSGVLPLLTSILFSDDLDVKSPASDIKELAAWTLGNIVSKPGHWESPAAGKEGNSVLSEHTVHKLLQLLAHSGPKNQLAFLRILSGIASSPRAEGTTLYALTSDV
ncbi:U-box domain-containing protein 44 [Nymphaea thermarum]|nr:U-box domain-containing protein 44 [Nymphaea thermarum]